jgi:hypothetical protein
MSRATESSIALEAGGRVSLWMQSHRMTTVKLTPASSAMSVIVRLSSMYWVWSHSGSTFPPGQWLWRGRRTRPRAGKRPGVESSVFGDLLEGLALLHVQVFQEVLRDQAAGRLEPGLLPPLGSVVSAPSPSPARRAGVRPRDLLRGGWVAGEGDAEAWQSGAEGLGDLCGAFSVRHRR